MTDQLYEIDYAIGLEDTSSQMDLEVMLRILHESYAGSDYLPEGEFDNLIKSIKSIEFEDVRDSLYEQLKEIFSNVSDNHLKIWKRFEDRNIHRTEELNFPVGKNMAAEKVVSVVEEDNILKIALASFPMPNEPLWDGFLDKIKSSLYKSELKGIILDLRGNTGGNDHYGYEMAALIFGGPFNHPICSQAVLQTPLSYLAMSNTFYKRNEEYAQAYKGKYYHALEVEKSDKFKVYEGEKDKTLITTDCINKPLFILIDPITKSSGESTALCFEDHPQVQYIGQDTNGCIEFGNVGLFVLPHSKVCIQISTHKNIFRDQRNFEKNGIQPHLFCETGVDALDVALKKLG